MLAAPSARAANRSAASVLTPAVPAWTTEPQIAPSCPSYKPGHVFQQVSICITIYAVIVLARWLRSANLVFYLGELLLFRLVVLAKKRFRLPLRLRYPFLQ